MNLMSPAEAINYNVICGMYLAGLLFAVFVYCVEKALSAGGLYEEEIDFWVNNKDSLTGLWMVFAPFGPGLVWSLWMRSLQHEERSRRRSSFAKRKAVEEKVAGVVAGSGAAVAENKKDT
jgi:hypothetical protein